MKNITCLTGAKPVAQLRVDLADFEGNHKYARYSYFSFGNPSTNYKLSVGGYSGTAGDSLATVHSGMQFTTYDRANDWHSGSDNCAVQWQSGWWYDSCHLLNLVINGLYLSGASDNKGMRWYTFNTAVGSYSLKWTEMNSKLK